MGGECVVGPRGLKLRARHPVLSNESLEQPGTEFRGEVFRSASGV